MLPNDGMTDNVKLFGPNHLVVGHKNTNHWKQKSNIILQGYSFGQVV